MAGRPSASPMIEAGHPVPDAAGLAGAERALALRGRSRRRRSRAGAALRRRFGQLDRAGPRHHARREAGDDAGAAAQRRQYRRDQLRAQTSLPHQRRPPGPPRIPAKLVTLAISDVPGDDPAVIGSGPTVPDPTTLADARAIVAKYRLELPETVTRALDDPPTNRRSPATRLLPMASIGSSPGRRMRWARPRSARP